MPCTLDTSLITDLDLRQFTANQILEPVSGWRSRLAVSAGGLGWRRLQKRGQFPRPFAIAQSALLLGANAAIAATAKFMPLRTVNSLSRRAPKIAR